MKVQTSIWSMTYPFAAISQLNDKTRDRAVHRPKSAVCFSLMKNMDWNDLRIFVRVARGGGLSAAAAELGSSPATVGRRMLALEQILARPLFVRRQTGYELT